MWRDRRSDSDNVNLSIQEANSVDELLSSKLSPIRSDRCPDVVGQLLASSLRPPSGTGSPRLQNDAQQPVLLNGISPELISRRTRSTDLEESLMALHSHVGDTQVCVEQAVGQLTRILERQQKTLANNHSDLLSRFEGLRFATQRCPGLLPERHAQTECSIDSLREGYVPTAADLAEEFLPGLIKELTPALTDALVPKLTRALSGDKEFIEKAGSFEDAMRRLKTGMVGKIDRVNDGKGDCSSAEVCTRKHTCAPLQDEAGTLKQMRARLDDEDPDWKKLEDTFFELLPRTAVTMKMQSVLEWYMHLKEPKRDGCLNWFVHHPKVEMLCVLVIIAHAGFTGYIANWELEHLNHGPSPFIQTVEWTFLVWYSVELLGKLSVHGLFFFANDDYMWNIFDIFLIGMSVYDQVLVLMATQDGKVEDAANISFMRIFRLMKLSKVMRVFRVLRFLRDLRLMLVAIRRSFMSLFWCLILLGVILYVFALIIVQGMSQYLAANEGLLSTHDVDNVIGKFGSIQTTCLSLYKAVTGGADWGEYAVIMQSAGLVYMSLFLFYTAFFSFVVMNILTAMIVENVVRIADTDDDNMLYHFQQQQAKLLQDIINVFSSIDTNHDGTIDVLEFMSGLKSPQVLALMKSLEIEVDNAEMFFKMLLVLSNTDRVDIHSFMTACVKMKGVATSLDLQCLMWESKIMRKDIETIKRGLRVD